MELHDKCYFFSTKKEEEQEEMDSSWSRIYLGELY